MAKTSLAFFRKSQTLSNLRFERPKSLETVRQVARDALEELEVDLECIEREFYRGKTVDEDIREIVGPIRRSTRTLSVSYLHSASQIRTLARKCRLEEDVEESIKDDVKTVQDYHEKVNEFMPSAFKDVLSDITDIRQCLEKYCLSFWEGEKDAYMEVAQHYEKKRKDIQEAIDTHAHNIAGMAEAYNTADGLQVKMFGIVSNDLARRRGVGDLPFLLMFPEACQDVRFIITALQNWVQLDERYVTFLRNDVSNLEQRRQAQVQMDRDNTNRLAHWQKGIQLNKKQIKEMKVELIKMRNKEKVINDEIDNLEKEIRFIQLDIEAKNTEKDKCRTPLVDQKGNSGVNDQADQLTIEIAKLRFSIPGIEKQIEVQKLKKKNITEKNELIAIKTKEIEDMNKQLAKEITIKEQHEKELKRIDFCVQCLNKIILRRTASDITKRIFHNLPIGPTKQTADLNIYGYHDDLSEAIFVTSELIGSDWPKLYVDLMTKVARGHKTIERDIREITEEKYRATYRVQALRSLRRWRRFDTYACVDTLKTTLETLRHKHIIKSIDDRFALIAADIAEREKERVIPEVIDTTEAEDAARRFMKSKGPLRNQVAQRTNNKGPPHKH